MKNLGPKSVALLAEAGLNSIAELKAIGPVLAFLTVKRQHPEASRNLLWAIYGAIHDIDWREISDETKASLQAEVDSHLM